MSVKLRVSSPGDDWDPATQSVYEKLGGTDAVLALANTFYDEMEKHEPELAKIHRRDEQGRISRESRDRFGLFLVGWLGGPQHYMERHGHPRLRMRHGHLPVNANLRDAWTRSMTRAMDVRGISGSVRGYLETRFAEVADFLRNVPEP